MLRWFCTTILVEWQLRRHFSYGSVEGLFGDLSVMLNWLLRAIYDIRMARTDATRKVLLDQVQGKRRRDKHARRCQYAVDAFAIKASIMCYARRRHVIFCTRSRSRHPSFKSVMLICKQKNKTVVTFMKFKLQIYTSKFGFATMYPYSMYLLDHDRVVFSNDSSFLRYITFHISKVQRAGQWEKWKTD